MGPHLPPLKRFQQPKVLEGEITAMLRVFKSAVENCKQLRNDVGKMLIHSIVPLITTVGGEDNIRWYVISLGPRP